MPLGDDGDMLGTETDGSKNGDFCIYCYEKGKFTEDITMDEMINKCVPFMLEDNDDTDEEGMTADEARAQLKQIFPKLKRWA